MFPFYSFIFLTSLTIHIMIFSHSSHVSGTILRSVFIDPRFDFFCGIREKNYRPFNLKICFLTPLPTSCFLDGIALHSPRTVLHSALSDLRFYSAVLMGCMQYETTITFLYFKIPSYFTVSQLHRLTRATHSHTGCFPVHDILLLYSWKEVKDYLLLFLHFNTSFLNLLGSHAP